MRWILGSVCAAVLAHGLATAQVSGDVMGMHNLTPSSGASISSQGSLGCTFCHAPHSGLGGVTPLWNQTLSKATYTPYSSTTYCRARENPANSRRDQQPVLELP